MNLAERIRTVRREHLALTQRELAQKLDVGEVVVSRWERNKAEPSLRYIRQLADLADLDVSWFFMEDGEKVA